MDNPSLSFSIFCTFQWHSITKGKNYLLVQRPLFLNNGISLYEFHCSGKQTSLKSSCINGFPFWINSENPWRYVRKDGWWIIQNTVCTWGAFIICEELCDGRMGNFYVLFNSISVISGRCADENERLCAMKPRLKSCVKRHWTLRNKFCRNWFNLLHTYKYKQIII